MDFFSCSTSLTFPKIDLLRLTVVSVSFLSNLPALEKLSINITGDNFAQHSVIQPNTLNPRTTFPSLKSLSIVTESLISVSQFVKSWQTPRLKIFAIEQWTPSRVWDLKDFFEALYYENKRNGHPLKELKLFNGLSAELDWGSRRNSYRHLNERPSFSQGSTYDLTQISTSSTQAPSLMVTA